MVAKGTSLKSSAPPKTQISDVLKKKTKCSKEKPGSVSQTALNPRKNGLAKRTAPVKRNSADTAERPTKKMMLTSPTEGEEGYLFAIPSVKKEEAENAPTSSLSPHIMPDFSAYESDCLFDHSLGDPQGLDDASFFSNSSILPLSQEYFTPTSTPSSSLTCFLASSSSPAVTFPPYTSSSGHSLQNEDDNIPEGGASLSGGKIRTHANARERDRTHRSVAVHII